MSFAQVDSSTIKQEKHVEPDVFICLNNDSGNKEVKKELIGENSLNNDRTFIEAASIHKSVEEMSFAQVDSSTIKQQKLVEPDMFICLHNESGDKEVKKELIDENSLNNDRTLIEAASIHKSVEEMSSVQVDSSTIKHEKHAESDMFILLYNDSEDKDVKKELNDENSLNNDQTLIDVALIELASIHKSVQEMSSVQVDSPTIKQKKHVEPDMFICLYDSGDKEVKKGLNDENYSINEDDRTLIEAEYNKVMNCAKKYGPQYELKELTYKFFKGNKCLICGFVSRARNFERHGKKHMTIHLSSRPYKCEICSQSFLDAGGLESHKTVHTDEHPYQCKYCEKAFKRKPGWRRHMFTHNVGEFQKKIYECEFCSKTFSIKRTLNYHLMRHTGELRYGCDICDRKFARPTSLKAHLASHSGEKNFTCKICDKAFSTNEHVKKHMNFHSDERKYQCKLCSSKFKFLSNLYQHERSMHSEERKHKCSKCKQSFKFPHHLKQHMNTHKTELTDSD